MALLLYSHSSGVLTFSCAATAAGMAATFGLASPQSPWCQMSLISWLECAAPVAIKPSGPPCHVHVPSSDQPLRMTYLYWISECAGRCTVTFHLVPSTQSISMPFAGTQFPSRSCPPTMHRWSPKLVSGRCWNVTATGGAGRGRDLLPVRELRLGLLLLLLLLLSASSSALASAAAFSSSSSPPPRDLSSEPRASRPSPRGMCPRRPSPSPPPSPRARPCRPARSALGRTRRAGALHAEGERSRGASGDGVGRDARGGATRAHAWSARAAPAM